MDGIVTGGSPRANHGADAPAGNQALGLAAASLGFRLRVRDDQLDLRAPERRDAASRVDFPGSELVRLEQARAVGCRRAGHRHQDAHLEWVGRGMGEADRGGDPRKGQQRSI